jgi:hypothetical protein
MTAIKHTPGPWFIWKELAMQHEGMAPDEIDEELMYCSEHDVMAGTPVGKFTRGSIGGCSSIVTLDSYDYEGEAEERSGQALANARLIAAAPEMLAALQALRDIGALEPDLIGSGPEVAGAQQAALDAIAKAAPSRT